MASQAANNLVYGYATEYIVILYRWFVKKISATYMVETTLLLPFLSKGISVILRRYQSQWNPPAPKKKSVASKLCISVGVKACSKNLRRAHYWWRASVVKRTSERRNCVLSLIIASFYNSPLWWSVFSLYNFAFCHTCNKQQFSFKRKRKVAKLINLADVIILQILRLTKRYLWVHAVIFDWFST